MTDLEVLSSLHHVLVDRIEEILADPRGRVSRAEEYEALVRLDTAARESLSGEWLPTGAFLLLPPVEKPARLPRVGGGRDSSPVAATEFARAACA